MERRWGGGGWRRVTAWLREHEIECDGFLEHLAKLVEEEEEVEAFPEMFCACLEGCSGCSGPPGPFVLDDPVAVMGAGA